MFMKIIAAGEETSHPSAEIPKKPGFLTSILEKPGFLKKPGF
jgi:hypothetical protein